MRLPAITAVLLLLALAFVGPATADHAYSHRYIVYGRVVDASGAPLQGVSVTASFEGLTPEGACDARHPPVTQSVTDAKGDYFWCFHVHRLTATTPKWVVKVANETKSGQIDIDLRKSRVDMQLPDNRPASRGNVESFNKSYTLWVTAWRPGETAIEGITVEGTALTDRAVSGTLTYNGGKTATATGTTNDYGDALLTFTLSEPLQSGTYVVTGPKDGKASGNADATFHASTAVLHYPGDPWYENSGLLGAAVIAGLAVAGGVAYGVVRMRGGSGAAGGRRRR